MKRKSIIISILSVTALLFVGCGDDSATDGGTDTSTGDTSTDTSPGDTSTDTSPGDTGTDTTVPPSADCIRYCDALDANCTDVPQYNNRAECESYCTGAGWPLGDVDDMSGNTIECRIYHAGVAAEDDAFHCPHAGPSGSGVCGSVAYRAEASGTRVDRMGMPAVSTALVGADTKNAYNDANPSDDAAGTYVSELTDSLTAIHTGLRDALVAVPLIPCSTDAATPDVSACLSQAIVPTGPTVASLVVPDTIQIDPSADAGFPNGRMLADPVMDVTLAIILLDMDPSTSQSPSTLAALPLNPDENDLAFSDEFPYLAAPHAP